MLLDHHQDLNAKVEKEQDKEPWMFGSEEDKNTDKHTPQQRPWPCRWCETNLDSKNCMEIYICEKCGAQFSRKLDLARHLEKSGHGDPNKLHYSPNFSYIWRIINSKIKENSTQRRHMKAKDALVLVKNIQRVGRELKQLRPDTVTLAFQNIPVLGLAVAIISFAEEAELRTLLFRVNLASAALGAGAKLFKASTVQGSTNTRNMYRDQLYNICKLIGQNQEFYHDTNGSTKGSRHHWRHKGHYHAHHRRRSSLLRPAGKVAHRRLGSGPLRPRHSRKLSKLGKHERHRSRRVSQIPQQGTSYHHNYHYHHHLLTPTHACIYTYTNVYLHK